MINSRLIGRYLKRARGYVGLPQSEMLFEIGNRWKEYGVSATCAECPKKCKISGVPGVSSFWCGDKINK